MPNDVDGLLLSTADAVTLREMTRWWRDRTKRPNDLSQPDELPQAPDVYIAVAPAGGIAGYTTPAGTDSGSDVADAHYASCKLYRIRHTSDTDVDVMPIGVNRDVWNLSTTAIAAGTIFLAIRDKPGKWIATPVGGGSPIYRFARFTLPSALATTDASKAACTVDGYWGGGDPGATITVYNLPASANYIFSGASGNKGLASWDNVNSKWWIVQMQCP